MLKVTIKNLDGETFTIDEAYRYEINLGSDVVVLPDIIEINNEKIVDVKISDIALSKKVRDENDPNSEGGWNGTVTCHYFINKNVSYFEGATLDHDILNQQLRSFYSVEYYVSYSPMLGFSDIMFNDTMESISELIEKEKLKEIKDNAERKEEENGEA